MKPQEIKVGGYYKAMVSKKLVTVKVLRERNSKEHGFVWNVWNMSTQRELVFNDAKRFIKPVTGVTQLVNLERKYTPQPTKPVESLITKKLAFKSQPSTDTAPHLIVVARAGTGKTTTLIEGLKQVRGLPSDLAPSPQQRLVWDSMALSRGHAKSICFVAFNKAIAEELKGRVPEGCDAMTMHSMGLRAVTRAFPTRPRIDNYRVQTIISELLGQDVRSLRRERSELLKATEDLVGLCKMNLVAADSTGLEPLTGVSDWSFQLSDLASHYDIDLNGGQQEIFSLVPRVLDQCKDVARDNAIDFNDMIWLPVVLNLSVYKYDLLLIDEAQDLNKCQQALALRAGQRLVLCGDPKQAIYGFAGADSESLTRIGTTLEQTERGCTTLPLTVTRRCGKAIVREAQRIVPDFEAFETNPGGLVTYCSMTISFGNQDVLPGYRQIAQYGDMVLCRCNAPLVSECFKFLKMGKKASVRGRDIGQGLISTIKKVTGLREPQEAVYYYTAELIGRLGSWLSQERSKEGAKRNPDAAKLLSLQDRYDCLMTFCDKASTVAGVVVEIEKMFTDDKGDGILLSSIHKAKGLEAQRVFFLRPKEAPCPHPMAKSACELEQEDNLYYVAVTRAREELVFVS